MEQILRWEDITNRNYEKIYDLLQILGSKTTEIIDVEIKEDKQITIIHYNRSSYNSISKNNIKEIIPNRLILDDKVFILTKSYKDINICTCQPIVEFITNQIPHMYDYFSDNPEKAKITITCFTKLYKDYNIGKISDFCQNFFDVLILLDLNQNNILELSAFIEIISKFYNPEIEFEKINCDYSDTGKWFDRLRKILSNKSIDELLSDNTFKEYKITTDSQRNYLSFSKNRLMTQFRKRNSKIFEGPYFDMYMNNPEIKLIDYINNYNSKI